MMAFLGLKSWSTPSRPAMSLPEAEADWVRMFYGSADIILEYGSGGSTVLAAERPETTIFSVESDRKWVASLQAYFDHASPKGKVHLHPVDIGPTKEWGNPKNERRWSNFHHYPISVWDRDDFEHPDLILIDGRFRKACFMTCALRIKQPTTLLFDDYADRPQYHGIEAYFTPQEIRGRMARFELKPMGFPVHDMAKIMEMFTYVG